MSTNYTQRLAKELNYCPDSKKTLKTIALHLLFLRSRGVAARRQRRAGLEG